METGQLHFLDNWDPSVPCRISILHHVFPIVGSSEMSVLFAGNGERPLGSILFADLMGKLNKPYKPCKSTKASMEQLLKSRRSHKEKKPSESLSEGPAPDTTVHQKGTQPQRMGRELPDNLRHIAENRKFDEHYAPPIPQDVIDKLQLDDEDSDMYRAVE